jgi:hypothetical protein
MGFCSMKAVIARCKLLHVALHSLVCTKILVQSNCVMTILVSGFGEVFKNL